MSGVPPIRVPGSGTQPNPVPLSDAARLQQTEQNAALKQQENQEKHAGAPLTEKMVTFYSVIAGCHYVFKNGKSAVFHNAKYATDNTAEIEELQALCKLAGNHMFYDHEVPVQQPDIKLLREVGHAGAAPGNNIIQGPVSSAGLTGL